MSLYTSIVRPVLFRFEPETAHRLTLAALRVPGLARLFVPARPPLGEKVSLMGLTFRNRLGIAAGVDKNGEAPLAWKDLGFGFAELGTVTFHAQPGNPRPRVFRYPQQQSLVNRLGFPNIGAKAFAEVAKVTGVVLTKLDGTAKGGIVYSIQQELGIPVKLVGVGEGIDDFSFFDAQEFARGLVGQEG